MYQVKGQNAEKPKEEPGATGTSTRGPMICYNCQGEGHMSRDCTEPRKPREPREDGEGGDQAQGEKKPRRRNNKKPKDDKETEGEAQAPLAEATPEAPAADGEKKQKRRNNKKPKEGETNDGKAEAAEPKYRVRGEEDEDKEAKEGEAPTEGEGKKRNRKPKNKKENQEKDGENAENGPNEPKYRVKGEKTEDEGEKAENKDKKPKEKPEKEKNLIYRNPLDFKEKKKFKSKWEEYHYGDWKRGSGKTFVTLDTVIPEVPAETSEPAEADYRKKKQDIDDRIKEINDNINEKKSQFDEILEKKHQHRSGQNKTEGDEEVPVKTMNLKEKFARMKELQAQKKKIYDEVDKITKPLGDLKKDQEALSKKIDPKVQSGADIQKTLKSLQKELETQSSDLKKENAIIKRQQLIRESKPHIEKRDTIKEQIYAINTQTKKVKGPIPKILQELKQLQVEIDEFKKHNESKNELLNEFDKNLERISDKKKQHWDEKDKLRKQKDELNDQYYDSLIKYSKFQYLLQDIKWMTEMKAKLQKSAEEKQKRQEDYEKRVADRKGREEEKKRREEEYAQKKIEKAEREAKAKEDAVKHARQNEIDALKRLDALINDTSVSANLMATQIQQCDALLKMCHKKLSDPVEEVKETEAEKEERKKASELEAKLKSGKVVAHTRDENFHNPAGSKKIKAQKTKKNVDKEVNSLDFQTIKQFSNLQLSAPITTQDFERSIKEINQLRDCLIYWGQIQQRIRKFKLIRDSKKLIHEEEYSALMETEEKFIESEKAKYSGDDTTGRTVDADKLKIAQQVYMKYQRQQDWEEDEHDDEAEQSSDDDRGFTADDAGDEDAPKEVKEREERRERKRPAKKDEKEAPARQEKFSKIFSKQENFPQLENDFADEEGSEEEDEAKATPE